MQEQVAGLQRELEAARAEAGHAQAQAAQARASLTAATSGMRPLMLLLLTSCNLQGCQGDRLRCGATSAAALDLPQPQGCCGDCLRCWATHAAAPDLRQPAGVCCRIPAVAVAYCTSTG